MLKLQFNLRHQDIYLVNRGEVVASDSKNYLVAQFNQLTDDWETPITAIFTDDKHQQPYAVIVGVNSELGENECFVPWEVLTDECNVYVSVYCGNLHTTVTAAFKVRKSGYRKSGYIDGETPPPPSPTVYTTIIKTLQDLDSGKQDKLTAGEHISIESDGTIGGFEVAGWKIAAIDNCIEDGVLYSTSINDQVAALVLARNITTDITQYAFCRDGRVMWRTRQAETQWQPAGEWSEWEEIGGSEIASGVVNQNGTISFYDADGNLIFTTTGESVIGPKGDNGDTGATGADGYSPTVSTTNLDAQTLVTVTDNNGAHNFYVKDGSSITNAAVDENGDLIISIQQKPTSSVHPTIHTLEVNAGHVVGAAGAKGEKGDKGDTGNDYVLTEQDKQDIADIVIQRLQGGD